MDSALDPVRRRAGRAPRWRGRTALSIFPWRTDTTFSGEDGHRSGEWTNGHRPSSHGFPGTSPRRRSRWPTWGAGVTAAALFAFSAAGKANEPVAIVEAVSAGAPVTLFSYLLQGQVISLDADAEVQIGYLHSCVQESVRGGIITIGRERSHVVGGERTEAVLDCRGATADLTRTEIEHSAAIVMREPVAMTPQLRLASTSPFIAPKGEADSVSWKRLDRSEPAAAAALRDGVADLADLGVTLARGGIYRFEADKASVIVQVATDARSGTGPILLRLLSF